MAGGIFSNGGAARGRDLDQPAVTGEPVITEAEALDCCRDGGPGNETGTAVGELIVDSGGAGQGVLAVERFVQAQHLTRTIDNNPARAPGARTAGAGGERITGAADGDVRPALDRLTAGECQVCHEPIGLTAETVVLDEADEARGGQAHQDAGDDHGDHDLDEGKAKGAIQNERFVFTDERSDLGSSTTDER